MKTQTEGDHITKRAVLLPSYLSEHLKVARLVEVLEQLPFNSRDEGKVILTRQLYSMQVQPLERRHQHR